MKGINGNTTAVIEINTGTTKNAIGSKVKAWESIQSIVGWLDLVTGDSRYNLFNSKMEESTHVFVADYIELDSRIKAENSRMLINGSRYDVKFIDDPMGMHKQIEIYLSNTGG